MIRLTRLGGEEFVLNASQIEMVESTPDTVIRLLSGKKLVVRESVEVVVQRVIEYERRIHDIAVLGQEGDDA
jgi:flagellar protein FlbD